MTTATTSPPSKPAPRAALPPGEVRVEEVLVIAGSALVLITGGFFALAYLYYRNKLIGELGPGSEGLVGGVVWDYVLGAYCWSFATFSVLGTAAITAAVVWPREVGHGLAALYGAAFVIAGAKIEFLSPMPALVGIMLIGVGVLMLVLAWTSWAKADRAAWAFLFALSGTLAIVMFFGTPRIRATLEDPRLFYVLVLPALMSAITVACYRLRRDYLSQGTPTTL